MRASWRIAIGTLAGATASLVWAVSLAVYEPVMKPHPYTDSLGQNLPAYASNNTYWPRETRQLAILLALSGVILICRASIRGIVTGGIATIIWASVDIWLVRINSSGRTTAIWLTVGSMAAYAVVAAIAARISIDRAGTTLTRYITATVTVVLAAMTMLVTPPWDEPVTDDQVRIEDALSILKAGLVVMFVVTAIALVMAELTPARIKRMALFLGLAVLSALPITTAHGFIIVALIAVPVAATLAIAATRDVPPGRLRTVAVACGLAIPPSAVVIYIAGSAVGSAMTAAEGNPVVNSADTDMSLSFGGLLIGLVLATLSYVTTRSEPPRPAWATTRLRPQDSGGTE
jgi:hypothetical protein